MGHDRCLSWEGSIVFCSTTKQVGSQYCPVPLSATVPKHSFQRLTFVRNSFNFFLSFFLFFLLLSISLLNSMDNSCKNCVAFLMDSHLVQRCYYKFLKPSTMQLRIFTMFDKISDIYKLRENYIKSRAANLKLVNPYIKIWGKRFSQE